MKNKTKNRRRTSFNVVDAGILLLLFAVLLVSVYFVFFADRISLGTSAQGNGEKTVIYTLEIRGVDNDLLNDGKMLPVLIGEEAYHVDASYALGNVKTVSEALPHMAMTSAVDEAGEVVYAPRPDKSNFVLEIEAVASFMDGSYVINGKVLRIGDTFTLATPFFASTVYCKNITEVNGNE